MNVLELEVSNIAGLADGNYTFTKAPDVAAPLTVISGPPGSGKTRMLECIIAAKEAVGAWGSTSRFVQLKRHGTAEATISTRWKLSDAERAEGGVGANDFKTSCAIDERGLSSPGCPIRLKGIFSAHDEAGYARFAYLHSERASPRYSSDDVQWYTALASDNAKFAHLLPRIVTLLAGDQAATAENADEGLYLPGRRSHLTDLREALRPFLPHPLVGFSNKKDEIDLVFLTRGGERLNSSQLSSSERAGLLLALDAILNYRWSGVVLLDEPELHRDLNEHVTFLKSYAALLRDCQLIVATSSPALTSNELSPGNIVRLSPVKAP